MLLYLTKITIFLALSLGIYKVALEKRKNHYFKRFYLLLTLTFGLLLPLISIQSNNQLTMINTKLQELNEVIITPASSVETMHIPWRTIILTIYIFGVVFMLFRFIRYLYAFQKLDKLGTIIYNRGQRFVYLGNVDTPFSFYKTIYLPLAIPIDWNNKIILHEYNHAKQNHTFDILFIEGIKSFLWFHPLLYFYKKSIALNHEFLADDALTNTSTETQEYLQLLLQQTYLQNELPLSSSFNFNLTKKRFIMITKNNKPWQNKLAAASAILLLCTAGTYTVFAQEKKNATVEKAVSNDPDKVFVAVQEQANYPGGMAEFNRDFIQNFVTPDFPEASARVIITFIVEKDGSLNDVKIVRDPGYGFGEATLAALAKTKKWKPAMHNGEAVRSQFTLPITIQVNPEKK